MKSTDDAKALEPGSYVIVKCLIVARGHNASLHMRKLAYQCRRSSVYEPHQYYCRDCKLRWNVDHPAATDHKGVTCSNCYGESITITRLRLWYPEKGGRK